MDHQGHLFVVHGKIESLVHDAAVIPVGERFRFNSIWRGVVGESPKTPRGWPGDGFARIPTRRDQIWALSVGPSGESAAYDVLLARAEGALRAIAEQQDDGDPVRGPGTLRLVAVPVIGIGRGGHSESRGRVLRTLTDRLDALAKELALDIALVTPDPAVYAAAQYARKAAPGPLPTDLEETARGLGALARDGDLALLLGAGVSMAAGLPSWEGLITQLSRGDLLAELGDSAQHLSPTDAAELIQKLLSGRFEARIKRIVQAKKRPSLLHALLAGLDTREVVTTNYDLLYEGAVEATGRTIESVMPWASAHGADRWVLKLHGDVRHSRQIVLTRRHMVRYDAVSRPSGAILQSLLLTRHLLVIGTSMTDDNVLRLAHEVQAYRDEHRVGGSFGTVLDAGGDSARRRLWADQVDWVSLQGPDRLWDGPRGVELLLDRVAFHAARDSSWLLDERFEGLLNDEVDRDLSRQARALYKALPTRPTSKWAPLVKRLRELGVEPDRST